MPLFRFGRNLQTDPETKVSVTCPRCGQVTDFRFAGKLPAAQELICRGCSGDIRREFLSGVIQAQLELQKSLRKRLLLITVLSVLPLGFLSAYIWLNAGALAWPYVLLVLSAIVCTGSAYLLFVNYTQIKKLHELQNKSQFNHE